VQVKTTSSVVNGISVGAVDGVRINVGCDVVGAPDVGSMVGVIVTVGCGVTVGDDGVVPGDEVSVAWVGNRVLLVGCTVTVGAGDTVGTTTVGELVGL
jgi:hypothetical protein